MKGVLEMLLSGPLTRIIEFLERVSSKFILTDNQRKMLYKMMVLQFNCWSDDKCVGTHLVHVLSCSSTACLVRLNTGPVEILNI